MVRSWRDTPTRIRAKLSEELARKCEPGYFFVCTECEPFAISFAVHSSERGVGSKVGDVARKFRLFGASERWQQ